MNSDVPVTRTAQRLCNLFDLDVVGVELMGEASPEWLHPEEAAFVQRAVDARKREFAGGRRCAREALKTLGICDFPLLVGQKRCPIWPELAVGSITHTKGYCGAVVVRRDRYAGIGVDVEQRGRVAAHLERRICTEPERRWLDTLEPAQRSDMATVLFSAKEAFYKCQFCITRDWLDFDDVSVHVEAEGSFIVEVHKRDPGLAAGSFRGSFSLSAEHVFAGIAFPPDRR